MLHYGAVLLNDELRRLLHDVPPHPGAVRHQTLHHLQHVGGTSTQCFILYCLLQIQSFSPFLVILCVAVTSGGRSSVLVIWPRHFGCAVLDCNRTQREEESTHWSDSSLPHGCAVCLYPPRLCRSLTGSGLWADRRGKKNKVYMFKLNLSICW